MKYLKYIIKDSWYAILFLLLLLIYLFTWSNGTDKIAGIYTVVFILLVLLIGKYKYFAKADKAGML